MAELSPLIQSFRNYLESYRHASPYTARCYEVDLRQFGEFLQSQASEKGADVDKLLTGADHAAVDAYLGQLRVDKYSPASIARKMATLRSFYKWLSRDGKVKASPMARIRTPKLTRQMPKALTLEQVDALLSVPDNRTILGARDRAILETFYACGIRVGELVALNRTDLDEEERELRVRMAGRKDRVAPLSPQALAAIRHYLLLSDPQREERAGGEARDMNAEPLFVNKDGGRLSTRSVRRKLDKYLREAGLDQSISPHTLRHSYAMHQLSSGKDLKDLQAQLGHRSVATTQIYKHMALAGWGEKKGEKKD